MSFIDFAKEELKRIGYNPDPDPNSDDINDYAVICILELLKTFAKQEHSNFSAHYILKIFNKLIKFEPLSPLTGEDDEWIEIYADEDEITYQNKRCARVFKTITIKTKEEKCHLNDHYVFVDKNGDAFTGYKSYLAIDKFPFSIPNKVYIHEGTDEAKTWIEKHQYDPFDQN